MPCSYEMQRLTRLAAYIRRIAEEKGITEEEALELIVKEDSSGEEE